MDQVAFWQLVDEARGARGDVVKQIARRLERLPSTEIADFDAWCFAYRSALYREDVWAAIYLIQGGCSDDGFDYFRAWLVAQGEAAVLAVVNDPEALGALVSGRGASLEEMIGVGEAVHRRVFGSSVSREAKVAIRDRERWPADRIARDVKWNTPELLATLYPRLWAVHGWTPAPAGELDHARFWAILDEAKGAAPELKRILDGLSEIERGGFARWAGAYNQTLVRRRDLQALARILFGTDSRETFFGFRGWLLSRGEGAFLAVMRDPDSLAGAPAASLPGLIVGFEHEDLPAIPGVETWCADWPDDGTPYRPDVLRARFPRVTAALTDAALTGDYDPARLDYFERKARVESTIERARASRDPSTTIRLADEGLRLTEGIDYASPERTTFIVLRARARVRKDELVDALADFELAASFAPHGTARMERANLLLAMGRRADAIAEVKRIPYHEGNPAVRAWLAEHAKAAPPKRVRHAKFGDGAVVAIEGIGDHETLTIEFADGRKKLRRRFVETLE